MAKADAKGAEQSTEQEQDYPRNWRFDEDGEEVRGKFVKFDVGRTAEYGECPILVLSVEGEERSVWLFHTALRNKFAEEVHRRDFEVGEQVNIRKAGEKKSAGSNRTYQSYVVTFPDAPPLDAKAIFGPLDPIDQGPVAYAQAEEAEPAELPDSTDF